MYIYIYVCVCAHCKKNSRWLISASVDGQNIKSYRRLANKPPGLANKPPGHNFYMGGFHKWVYTP